jgi:hypothetical protein
MAKLREEFAAVSKITVEGVEGKYVFAEIPLV